MALTGQGASEKTEIGSRLPRSFGSGKPTWRARGRAQEASTSPLFKSPYYTPNKEKDGTHLHSNSGQGLHGNNYPKIHSRQSQQQELAKKTLGVEDVRGDSEFGFLLFLN